METIEGTIASEWELAGKGMLAVEIVGKKVFPTGKVQITRSKVAVKGCPDLIIGKTIKVNGEWSEGRFIGIVEEGK